MLRYSFGLLGFFNPVFSSFFPTRVYAPPTLSSFSVWNRKFGEDSTVPQVHSFFTLVG